MPDDTAGLIFALLGGGFLGTWTKTLFDAAQARREDARAHQRQVYADLLAILENRKQAARQACTAPLDEVPEDIDQAHVDRTMALLELNASPEVRAKASRCLELNGQFWVSWGTRQPVIGVQNGIYQYDPEAIGLDKQQREPLLRRSLSRTTDQLVAVCAELADAMKRDLYGRLDRRTRQAKNPHTR